MNPHLTTDEIHDWLDGLLDMAAEGRARRHVQTCAACRKEKEALADVLQATAELPRAATPFRELWGGIDTRIAGTAPGEAETVVAKPSSAEVRARRAVSLTLPQAFAAGIAVALLSAAAVWYSLGVRAPAGSAGIGAPDSPAALATAEIAAQNDLEQAVFELERTVEEGRARLAPQTLTTIEQSLRTIDRAIDEARQALVRDPSSELLNRLLLNHQKGKLRILRQATSLLLASA
jgi:hypothetical protein